MRAVVFRERGRVEVTTVPEPVLVEPDDALVRVRRAAVCGTDLHLVQDPRDLATGSVLGHEYVGTVVDVGPAVRGIAAGDRVGGADFTACGHCWWCRRGDHWECAERQFFGTGATFGPALAGAQAELLRVPHAGTTLHVLPAGVSDDAAIFLGDVLATGYAAVQRAGLRVGDTIAIVGGGPVGQLTSLAAQASGAGPVVVVEPVAERRALAAAHGALAVTPKEARGLVDAVTSGRGADAVVDAVGAPVGIDTALSLVRRRGTIVSAGVPTVDEWPLPITRAFADETTLRFVIGDAMRDRDQLTALVETGVLDPTVVVSQVVDLEQAADAYARMAARSTLKVLIRM
ncbi:MAG TPA: alcohol dehydrogenase catalytic domain-containing protein [Streptosporangiaceae bacterium]